MPCDRCGSKMTMIATFQGEQGEACCAHECDRCCRSYVAEATGQAAAA